MLPSERFLVFGGTAHHGFDAKVLNLTNVVTGLDLKFRHLWYQGWPDGEPGFRMEKPELIKDRHVVIFSCPITLKHTEELHDLITATKKQYAARSVIAVLPFIRFRRQDHAEFVHEITRLRWFLSDLKYWGADDLIACEPHSVENMERFCKEFGLKLHIANPTKLFAEAIRGPVQAMGGVDTVRMYSPDFGSVGRAIALARELGLTVVATPKQRLNGRISIVDNADFLAAIHQKYGPDAPVSCDVEELRGLNVIMCEDEIDTAGTAVTTAVNLRRIGAKSVRIVATHPVCSPGWKMRLFPFGEPPPFENIWLGDTRPRGNETEYEGSTGRIDGVSMAPAVAATLVKILESITD